MTSGTVIPSLMAGAASDAAGSSEASTSNDHTITYTPATALSAVTRDTRPTPSR